MGSFDKRSLRDAFTTHLRAEVERGTRRALDAAQAATHEDNKPEGDKDMRSTEASYVARGQAARVHVLESARAKLSVVPLRDFAPGDEIAVGALVDVEHRGARTTYYVVPAAGGIRLDIAGREFHTLATTSPLGKAMLGLQEGDLAEVETPQGLRSYVIGHVR